MLKINKKSSKAFLLISPLVFVKIYVDNCDLCVDNNKAVYK